MQQDKLLSRSDYVPDIIRGDLDSIRPDVLDYYSKLGTQYVLTSCLEEFHMAALSLSLASDAKQKSRCFLALSHCFS